jgi:predicted dienelactone hydrolase
MLKFFTKIIAITIGLLAINPLAAKAAEKITIAYNILEFSVSVASLERFASEGQIDADLKKYTQYLKQPQIDQLKQILTQKVALSSVDVSQLSYSSFGESSLSFIGDIIQIGPQQNGLYGIRSALILAADSNGFTIIDVIKKFPTPVLRVNSIYLIEVMERLNQLDKLNNRSLDLVIEQSQQETNRALSNAVTSSKPQKWYKENLSLIDPQRQRSITADLYQPDSQQPTPLLVISPGLASNLSESIFIELAEHLASQGFTVAVIEHPNSNTQQLENLLQGMAREVMEPSEFIDRPRDVSYLLDELTKRNNSTQWRDRIDLQRVGVMGHSFGGYTALALVGAQINFANLRQICAPRRFDLAAANVSLILQCEALKLPEKPYQFSDKRIQAAFIFNPIGSAVFGEAGLRQVKTPVFMVSGSKDKLASPLLEQVCPFTWLNNSHKYLAMIQGATHSYSTTDAPQNRLFTLLGSNQIDPPIAREYLKSLSLTFFKTHTQQQSSGQTLLKYEQVETPNPSAGSLHLIQNLSKTQIKRSLNITCPGATGLSLSANSISHPLFDPTDDRRNMNDAIFSADFRTQSSSTLLHFAIGDSLVNGCRQPFSRELFPGNRCWPNS